MKSLKLIIHVLCVCLMISLCKCTSNPRSHDKICHDEDKAILLQIKSHFGGVGLLSDWDPNVSCDVWPFIGVTSEENAHPGRVTALTVGGGTGLSGQIPSIIGNLRYLTTIMFQDEPNLTGPIPESFSKLNNLIIINLDHNGLTGPIPDFLGGLNKLQQIDISNNRLTGGIPPSFSNLTALTDLNVSGNRLCGAVPSGLNKFGVTAFEHNKCLCGAPLHAC